MLLEQDMIIIMGLYTSMLYAKKEGLPLDNICLAPETIEAFSRYLEKNGAGPIVDNFTKESLHDYFINSKYFEKVRNNLFRFKVELFGDCKYINDDNIDDFIDTTTIRLIYEMRPRLNYPDGLFKSAKMLHVIFKSNDEQFQKNVNDELISIGRQTKQIKKGQKKLAR